MTFESIDDHRFVTRKWGMKKGKPLEVKGKKKKTRKKKENVKISRVKNLQNSIRVRRFDFCKLRPPKKKKEAKRRTHAIPFFFF